MTMEWQDFVKEGQRNTLYRVAVNDPRPPKPEVRSVPHREPPQLRAATKPFKSNAQMKEEARALRDSLMQVGNSNPDEMLGRRMNPILIAPGFALGGAAPTSVSGAIGLGATGIGVEEGLAALSKTHPRIAAAANMAMVAAPVVLGAKRAVGRQARHSSNWKARRILSKIPAEESKIQYGVDLDQAIKKQKAGTVRLYRGSRDSFLDDINRDSVLATPKGYDPRLSKGLLQRSGENLTEKWSRLPVDIRDGLMEYMKDYHLATPSIKHAKLFSRGKGDKSLIHVYDVPEAIGKKLRYSHDAGQQHEALRAAERADIFDKPLSGELARLPTGGLDWRTYAPLDPETIIPKSVLRDSYVGTVTWEPPRQVASGSDWRTMVAVQAWKKRLARRLGGGDDLYAASPDQIRTYSPHLDTINWLNKRIQSGADSYTWLDRVVEMLSPTRYR